MTLIKCPECKGQVSTEAAACPHCGKPVDETARQTEPEQAPVKTKKSPTIRPFTIVLMALFFAIPCCGFWGAIICSDRPSPEQTAADRDAGAQKRRERGAKKELLESLQLQPLSMLTSDSFKEKHGLPEKTRESGGGKWVYYYYPKGDFTVQVDMEDETTANVYEGRWP